LFAVGSTIGKAQEVDVAFTRQNSEVWMRVLVTNPKYIPKGLSIMCMMVLAMAFSSRLRVKVILKRGMFLCMRRVEEMIRSDPPSIPRIICQRTQPMVISIL
jgi:hypothetical protein